MRGTGTSQYSLRPRAHRGGVCRPIINHPSSIIHSRAFTLIELLVVISVIALLLSILAPALRQARRQTGAVVCQARLRQWGVLFSHRATANDGELIITPDYMGQTDGSSPLGTGATGGMYDHIGALERCYGREIRGLFLCPVASRLDKRFLSYISRPGRYLEGNTFRPWCGTSPDTGELRTGSYSFNAGVSFLGYTNRPRGLRISNNLWTTPFVQQTATIPVMHDSGSYEFSGHSPKSPPPPYEDLWGFEEWGDECINRHNGYVNYLFLDWSVRKVGLKELWTLQWFKDFDTHGPWTRAGGVRPGSWPQWMRGFKDY